MSLINTALADEGVVAGGNNFDPKMFIPYLAIFIIFYFFLIRPQAKKQKEVQNMINALEKGDKVFAAGGIIGKIVKITDNIVDLEISSGVKIQVSKNSITEKVENTSKK